LLVRAHMRPCTTPTERRLVQTLTATTNTDTDATYTTNTNTDTCTDIDDTILLLV